MAPRLLQMGKSRLTDLCLVWPMLMGGLPSGYNLPQEGIAQWCAPAKK
jgi:hypothetical protein